MKNYSKLTPEGTKDYLFDECNARNRAENILCSMFSSRGYKKIVSPVLEFFDVFNRESAGMPVEDLYSLTDTSGRLLVLRPDNTMPIARIAATRLRDIAPPIRLYYNQRVFRRNPNFTGFNDETSQCGIELLGASGIKADLEVICTALDALRATGTSGCRIEIGHADFFNALSNELETDKETVEQIRYFVEKKNYSMLNDLLDSIGDNSVTRAIKLLPRLFGGAEVLDTAREMCDSESGIKALDYIQNIYSKLSEKGFDKNISIDLGLVHRNNYYTGLVFRGYIEGSGITVLSGGRYDTLISEFGRSLPAIGFGIEINAVAGAMLSRGEIESVKSADVLVFGKSGFEIDALERAKELTAQGLICENCVLDSESEAKAYAEAAGIKRVEIVG